MPEEAHHKILRIQFITSLQASKSSLNKFPTPELVRNSAHTKHHVVALNNVEQAKGIPRYTVLYADNVVKPSRTSEPSKQKRNSAHMNNWHFKNMIVPKEVR